MSVNSKSDKDVFYANYKKRIMLAETVEYERRYFLYKNKAVLHWLALYVISSTVYRV